MVCDGLIWIYGKSYCGKEPGHGPKQLGGIYVVFGLRLSKERGLFFLGFRLTVVIETIDAPPEFYAVSPCGFQYCVEYESLVE